MSEDQNQRLALKISEAIMPEIQQLIERARAEGRAEARREAAQKIRGIAIRNVNGSMIVNMEAVLHILSDKPKDGRKEKPSELLECSVCGNLDGPPYEPGDTCSICGIGEYRRVNPRP